MTSPNVSIVPGYTPRVKENSQVLHTTLFPRPKNHLVIFISNPGQNNTNALDHARVSPIYTLKGKKKKNSSVKAQKKMIQVIYTWDNSATL